MAGWVRCQVRHVFLEFLIAAWTGCRKYLSSYEIRLDALDVAAAAGCEREAEPVRLWVHLDQPFNRTSDLPG
jgi:hypothetical protein